MQVEFNKAAVSLAEQLDNPQKKQQAMSRLMKVCYISAVR
jgi:uncharacterized protein (DUF1778 family)